MKTKSFRPFLKYKNENKTEMSKDEYIERYAYPTKEMAQAVLDERIHFIQDNWKSKVVESGINEEILDRLITIEGEAKHDLLYGDYDLFSVGEVSIESEIAHKLHGKKVKMTIEILDGEDA